ncbi:hypothetical protein B0H63DRAFT_537274 [Podospora didyma]|uniref:Apple domain-containing protein n=1 Tax=Podospora didyma TaxID=330526 RepID=A0AAE0NX73_9PEZI|nr:hypothetical protein B0H63DRAFT_537274 [Podospora didyma]
MLVFLTLGQLCLGVLEAPGAPSPDSGNGASSASSEHHHPIMTWTTSAVSIESTHHTVLTWPTGSSTTVPITVTPTAIDSAKRMALAAAISPRGDGCPPEKTHKKLYLEGDKGEEIIDLNCLYTSEPNKPYFTYVVDSLEMCELACYNDPNCAEFNFLLGCMCDVIHKDPKIHYEPSPWKYTNGVFEKRRKSKTKRMTLATNTSSDISAAISTRDDGCPPEKVHKKIYLEHPDHKGGELVDLNCIYTEQPHRHYISYVIKTAENCALACYEDPECAEFNFSFGVFCDLINNHPETLHFSPPEKYTNGILKSRQKKSQPRALEAATATPHGSDTYTCPGSDGAIVTYPDGRRFVIDCFVTFTGRTMIFEDATSFVKCMDMCHEFECSHFSWDFHTNIYRNNCRLAFGPTDHKVAKNTTISGREIKGPRKRSPSNGLVARSLNHPCPEGDGDIISSANGFYHIECDTDRVGADINMTKVASYKDCVIACSLQENCRALSFWQNSDRPKNCYLKSTIGVATLNPYVLGAVPVDLGPTPYRSFTPSYHTSPPPFTPFPDDEPSTIPLPETLPTTTQTTAPVLTLSLTFPLPTPMSTSIHLATPTSTSIPYVVARATVAPSCPAAKNTSFYYPPNHQITVECDADLSGDAGSNWGFFAFEECYRLCSLQPSPVCTAVAWNSNTRACYFKKNKTGPTTQKKGTWLATVGPALVSCPAANGTSFTYGTNHRISVECDTDHVGGDVDTYSALNFDACYEVCILQPDCIGAAWNSQTEECFMKNATGPATHKAGTWFARVASSSGRKEKRDDKREEDWGDRGCAPMKGTTWRDGNIWDVGASQCAQMYCDTDFVGGDFQISHNEQWDTCYAECNQVGPNCKGFVFVPTGGNPSIHLVTGDCFVKNHIGIKVSRAGSRGAIMSP